MDFTIPQDLEDYYSELVQFIEAEIEPLVAKDDNIRFFDHRRENARTDWERGGLPNHEGAGWRARPRSPRAWRGICEPRPGAGTACPVRCRAPASARRG